MPKSRAQKSKKNRDFLMRKDKYLGENYLKYFDLAVKHFINVTEFTRAELMFMLYVYDYEFFTLDYMSESYGRSKQQLYMKIVNPLKNKQAIENYYNNGTSTTIIDSVLHIDYKTARISLSTKGRHAVQRFYRMLDGREEVLYH